MIYSEQLRKACQESLCFISQEAMKSKTKKIVSGKRVLNSSLGKLCYDLSGSHDIYTSYGRNAVLKAIPKLISSHWTSGETVD